MLALVGPLFLSGCYYGQLASGQLELMWRRQPLEQALADPRHPGIVRERLRAVDAVRRFAADLGLAVGNHYTSYVDWPGDRIVTTLVRTRKDSLETAPWWFPVVGSLPYKGYFDRARAEAEAARIRARGEYDVCVSGVAAYSTLGWLDDPVTQPMVSRGVANLVETLFHELVHATAFLPDAAEWNEGVAQFIGQQAAIRFFATHEARHATVSTQRADELPGSWPSAERVRAAIEDRLRIAESMLAFRERVRTLDGLPDRAARRVVFEARARHDMARLPLAVLDAQAVAEAARLSDACLALRGAYVRDLPRHARVLEALGGDLRAMVARLRRWQEQARPPETFFDVEPAPGLAPSGRSMADELDHALVDESAKDLEAGLGVDERVVGPLELPTRIVKIGLRERRPLVSVVAR